MTYEIEEENMKEKFLDMKDLENRIKKLEECADKLEKCVEKVNHKQAMNSLRLEYHIDNLKDVFKNHMNSLDAHRV